MHGIKSKNPYIQIFLNTYTQICLQSCVEINSRHTHTHTHTTHTHIHTLPFNGPFSGTTRVSRYQKDETNLDFTEARDSEWQWNQLGHIQVCISLQTDNHASTPLLEFFTGRMPFLLPNQQHQSTVDRIMHKLDNIICTSKVLSLIKSNL